MIQFLGSTIHNLASLNPIVTNPVSCSISPPDGVLFNLPLKYYFAGGHPRVSRLAKWSLLMHQDSPCVMLLGFIGLSLPIWCSTAAFHWFSWQHHAHIALLHHNSHGLGCSNLFPTLESLSLSFPLATTMFQFVMHDKLIPRTDFGPLFQDPS